jgi:proteasome lid subunit RPN8/RPN11
VVISAALVNELVAHAREELPNECCGIIATKDGEAMKVFRAANTYASPLRYEIDSKDLIKIYLEIEGEGWELGGIYHSHTKSPAVPSQTDINEARWPDAVYLIVSLADADNPDVRAYRIADSTVSEVELAVS